MMASGAPIHQLISWDASLPVSAVHAEPHASSPHRVHAPRRHVLVPRRLIAHADREHNEEPRRDERKHELGYMKSM